MKHLFALAFVALLASSGVQAQCLSDQIVGKRWVCVAKEQNGERVKYDVPYFTLTLENDNRFSKTSYEEDGRAVTNYFDGTYAIGDCHLLLSSRPRSVQEGVVRRIEEYEIEFNNDRYMTLSVTINGVLSRTYYCVYAGKPDEHNYSDRRNRR